MSSLLWTYRKHLAGLGIACLLLLCMFTLLSQGYARLTSRTIKATGASGNVPVFTFKYNNQQTGGNTDEEILNTNNVSSHQFGKLMSYRVDGQIYAQPLYVPTIYAGGSTRNLVIVATENNSVYAFDANQFRNGKPVWHTNFAVGRAITVPASDERCNDLTPKIGITSTPVIANNTLFVVSHIFSHGNYIYHLHALSLSTGRDKIGSPVEVHVPGNNFDPKMERQRAALLYANGRIYIAFSSFCDHAPYHGWIISYRYNGQMFSRAASWNDTPGGKEGGIWGGGGPLAADEDGYIYATTGNGTFNLNSGGNDAGDSYVKLNANLQVLDYFTPFNQQCLNASDGDLGSGGPLLLPGNELTSGTKDGKIYVVSTNHMGHYNAMNHPCEHERATNLDHIVQELPIRTMGGGIYSVPTYWNGYVYFSGSKDKTKVFRFSHGRLSGPVSSTPEKIGFTGGNPTISSDRSRAGTGILWLIDSQGILRAYDATNLANELYHGNLGSYIKFSVPVVSNGEVFVPTADELEIFGLQNTIAPGPKATSTLPVPTTNGSTGEIRPWRRLL